MANYEKQTLLTFRNSDTVGLDIVVYAALLAAPAPWPPSLMGPLRTGVGGHGRGLALGTWFAWAFISLVSIRRPVYVTEVTADLLLQHMFSPFLLH